ncbi:hypothetical protein P3S68_033211 [Capsicum galapagoense]
MAYLRVQFLWLLAFLVELIVLLFGIVGERYSVNGVISSSIVVFNFVEMGTIHAEDFMRCFCSNLGVTNQTVKAAQEAVKKNQKSLT